MTIRDKSRFDHRDRDCDRRVLQARRGVRARRGQFSIGHSNVS